MLTRAAVRTRTDVCQHHPGAGRPGPRHSRERRYRRL